MEEISELVAGLFAPKESEGYECLKKLRIISEKENTVYPYFDKIAQLLENPSAYNRMRAIWLISDNAKWDSENEIDEIISQYLTHVEDPKPATSRQCIQALPNIAKYKPDLVDDIVSALQNADPEKYKDSMSPLIYKDIQIALAAIASDKEKRQ